MKLRFRTVLIVVLVLVAGCGVGGGDPTPTPSMSSVVSATPTPTPTPTPTSSADALYAEAERVCRASLDAQWKFELTGDYSEFPPEFAEYFSPEYLSIARQVFDRAAKDGVRLTGGVPVIETGPAREQSKDDSVVALDVCYDARGLIATNARGEVLREGALIKTLVYLKYYDGVLKIFDSESSEVVACSVH